MHNYETARDVLDCVIDFHHGAADLLIRLHEQSEDANAKVLFNCLYEHEIKMEASVGAYEQHIPQDVLDTWLPETFEIPPSPQVVLDSLEAGSDIDPDTANALGESIDKYPIALFAGASDKVPWGSLHQLFGSLYQLETRESRHLLREVNSLRSGKYSDSMTGRHF